MPSLEVHRHGGGSKVQVRNRMWSQPRPGGSENHERRWDCPRGQQCSLWEQWVKAGVLRTPCTEEGTVGTAGTHKGTWKGKVKEKKRRAEGGRCWRPASVSQHLTSRHRRLLTANTHSLPEGFFLALETLLAPGQGKPEELESECAWKQPSTNDREGVGG